MIGSGDWCATTASPLELTAESERPYVEQTLLAPIQAAHTLLVPMLERKAGALLFTLGASARGPIPQLAQAGPLSPASATTSSASPRPRLPTACGSAC